MRIFIRWFFTAIALVVAAMVVPGINISDNNGWVAVAIMAVVLGLVNVFIRPILSLLSCGFIIVTMGLFMIVINAISLLLASWIAVNWFGAGFYVDGFWSALLGAIVISVVSFLLSILLPDKKRSTTKS